MWRVGLLHQIGSSDSDSVPTNVQVNYASQSQDLVPVASLPIETVVYNSLVLQ
jgi:hypothetical protein